VLDFIVKASALAVNQVLTLTLTPVLCLFSFSPSVPFSLSLPITHSLFFSLPHSHFLVFRLRSVLIRKQTLTLTLNSNPNPNSHPNTKPFQVPDVNGSWMDTFVRRYEQVGLVLGLVLSSSLDVRVSVRVSIIIIIRC
jgi:hypothetical protein